MTNVYRSGLLLFIFVLLSSIAGAGETRSIDADHFHLEWTVDGAMLHVEVSAPVEGWVAVGFDPTNKMKDANIIIGYVEDGAVTLEDHYGNTPISHREDTSQKGQNNIINPEGRESGGITTLSFSIPLDSGDSRDRALVEGQTYTVILASHSRDRLTVKHSNRTSVEIVL